MKNLIFTFLFVSLTSMVWGQDQHFTQFISSPLVTNPAMTGLFGGKYRLSTIYRNQWRGALQDPYVTFAAALDVRFELELNSQYKDAAAVGLLFSSDKVSNIDFSTNTIALSGAFHKGLDYDHKQFLTLGIQGGVSQRNVSYEALFFDDQFNGTDEFNQATQEDLPANNFSYGDFAAGLNYIYRPKDRSYVNTGLSMHHILQPQVTFYDFEDEENPYEGSKLFSKYSAQVSAEFPINDNFSIMPRALYALQGPHQEIVAGANLRMIISDYMNNSLMFGGWVRPVSNADKSFNVESVALMVGLEYYSWLFGFSFESNLVDLTQYHQGQNAFEISVTYLGEYENDSILCPSF